jgi:hypothetical protein
MIQNVKKYKVYPEILPFFSSNQKGPIGLFGGNRYFFTNKEAYWATSNGPVRFKFFRSIQIFPGTEKEHTKKKWRGTTRESRSRRPPTDGIGWIIKNQIDRQLGLICNSPL